MEITGPQNVMAMKNANAAMSADIAVLKKSIDVEKDMATQLIDAIPKVKHDAPPGQQVRAFA